MCHHRLGLLSQTTDTNTLKATNPKEYVEKFDEFLIRCRTLHKKGEAQILSGFRAALEMTYELNCQLEKSTSQMQHMCQSKIYILLGPTTPSRVTIMKSVSRPSPAPQSNRSSTQTPSHKNDIKGKNLEWDNKNKSPEFPKVGSTIKCYKC